MSYKKNHVSIFEQETVPHWAPIILDDQSLSYQMGVDNRALWQAIIHSNKPAHNEPNRQKADRNPLYTRIEIPAKQGKKRVVYDASDELPRRAPLKKMLKSLAVLLFKECPWPEYIDAYVPQKSIKNSAEKHAGAKTAFFLDIVNFFPSVTRAQIRRALRQKFSMNPKVVNMIGSLVTLEGFLPQGSPIASQMANLVGWDTFDDLLSVYLSKKGWRYSRYSDDIIVSHEEDVDEDELQEALRYCVDTIEEKGFLINRKKTRVSGIRQGRTSSMRWLGYTLNSGTPNIKQKDYRRIRQVLWHASQNGFVAQADFMGEDVTRHIQVVRGKLNHLKSGLCESRSEKLQEYFDAAIAVDHLEQTLEIIENDE